jgi:type IV pilus assembly protein PilA
VTLAKCVAIVQFGALREARGPLPIFDDVVLLAFACGVARGVCFASGCLSCIPPAEPYPPRGTSMPMNSRRGFTLIELLIVVVIIGILAAIAIPKFANTKSKAYVTAMKSDLRNLVTAEEAFFSDSSHYTTVLGNLKFNVSSGVNAPTIATGSGWWTATNTHTQLTGATCGIGANTTSPTVTTAGEGEPACKIP